MSGFRGLIKAGRLLAWWPAAGSADAWAGHVSGRVSNGLRGALPDHLPGSFNALARLSLSAKSRHSQAGSTDEGHPAHGSATRQGGFFQRRSLKVRAILIAPLVAGFAAMVLFTGLMVYYTIAFPHPLLMGANERSPIVRILARDGSVLAERGSGHDHMPLRVLPRHVQAAVIATEDRRFFDHHGLDPMGMMRAFFANLRAGRFVQGGSTLTQQLAKNLFLSSERTLARKAEELALAFWLELRLSKADILELYLNRVYFGAGAYGIEAASQRYFDKSARELSLPEGALIAGLLKAPSRYSPASNPDLARARGRVVLRKMLDAGFISRTEMRHAMASRVVFASPKSSEKASGDGYAIDYVLDQMPKVSTHDLSKLIVETTLDAPLQRRAFDVVRRGLGRSGKPLGVSQAAVVVLDGDGGIRAMVGGRDYKQSQYNRATSAKRQPGSAFKPIVYLAAMEAGMTPDSVAHDLPIKIQGWAPRNDNGQYIGAVSLRKALAKSINTVAVQLHQLVGAGRTVQTARRLGITSELRDDPSLALGTSEVTLLEMASAYSVFSNGGRQVPPHVVTRIRKSTGEILYERDTAPPDVVTGLQQVGAMNDMLNAALVSGTGRRAAIADHPAAGKTGTTQDHRDAWFVGYTSHLTAGVWIGNDKGEPMKHATGGGLPAEMWHEIMVAAHHGRVPLQLPGTVSEAAPQQALARSIPRVGQEMEHLPWRDQPVEPSRQRIPPVVLKPLAPTATPAIATRPRHPTEQIDPSFIDQAIADLETPVADGDQAQDRRSASAPPQRSRFGGWW